MKKIEAVIRPNQLTQVREHLVEAGINGMLATSATGYGNEIGYLKHYRGNDITIGCQEKVKLELIVPRDLLDIAVEAIIKGARTGEIGDGKIWISPIEKLIRIRTGETDIDAV